MKNSRSPRNVITARSKLAAAILLLAAGSISAHEVQQSGYRMTVIQNEAYGRFMMFGKFEKGIARINTLGSRGSNSFAAKNNLCVGLTKTGDLEQAREACDAALAISEQSGRFGETPLEKEILRDQTLAYSNRGVLRAVAEDFHGAMEDFEYAAELDAEANVDVALDNLVHHRAKLTTALTALQEQR